MFTATATDPLDRKGSKLSQCGTWRYNSSCALVYEAPGAEPQAPGAKPQATGASANREALGICRLLPAPVMSAHVRQPAYGCEELFEGRQCVALCVSILQHTRTWVRLTMRCPHNVLLFATHMNMGKHNAPQLYTPQGGLHGIFFVVDLICVRFCILILVFVCFYVFCVYFLYLLCSFR